MSATALILAAGLAAASTSAWPVDASPVPGAVTTPAAAETPNLYRQPARCGALHERVVQSRRAAMQGRMSGKHYAVLRRVDGCPVAAPMGYHPDYLAPGKADAPQYRPISETERR